MNLCKCNYMYCMWDTKPATGPHQRIVEHKTAVIGKHFLDAHGDNNLKESQMNFPHYENVMGNLIASYMRCSSRHLNPS